MSAAAAQAVAIQQVDDIASAAKDFAPGDGIVNLETLDPATLMSNAFGFIDNAYSEHNFLVGVLQDENKDDLSPEMLRNIQNELEKFTVKTQLIGKTVSVLLKGVDTLVKMQ
ncbi:MAG: hypothetical protein QG673_619 [Pseudomonadota bacterium]|nr:hypothetical protein [Pseudomonadota bacterium]